ncbi:acyclic terpene utilization AtuA family protein [Nocardioides yefusunii]|uniref:Acyclic terpene utilization AtuA family protein n=1 Tax=Nocardioides yefusunii TaxID=2500546 RepID=A0ABW1R137_9ACTN|nr:acyclic terpene utilization AtuA family protein [Nocardioides yefusunii]
MSDKGTVASSSQGRAARIGNMSGFYGDRLSAMHEMLARATSESESLDYLTGDYLAELTLLILGKDTFKDPNLGYARTFVRQAEQSLGLALEKGVKIVVNAGGLNPTGLVEKLREVASGLGLAPRIATVVGDDLRASAKELGWDNALTANAYLGAFGITSALSAGADVVVTGRVTDASLVVGPAAHFHGWTPDQYDALAGAVVAGHVIECGTQATGGNFSGFMSLPAAAREQKMGFPLAEIAADGSSVITKHAGTGGAVTVDTVTAQLVYEIQSAHYLNPDVTTHLESIAIAQESEDRVAISGVTGSAPPEQLKVCLNELGGFRNSIEFLVTGLDVDAKVAWAKAQLEAAWAASGKRPAKVQWALTSVPAEDPATMEAASCVLRCSVLDPDGKVAGKGLTAPAVEFGLASYPGFTLTAPPSPATPYGIYRPEYVARTAVEHTVVHHDGRREVIADPTDLATTDALAAHRTAGVTPSAGRHKNPGAEAPILMTSGSGATVKRPLGTFVHARSGDKGGDANIGLWVANTSDATSDSGLRKARVDWLLDLITPDVVRDLVPEAADLDVDVYALPNLGAVNVVVRGLLGAGVAAGTRTDPQAKALGEWVRARHAEIPEELL